MYENKREGKVMKLTKHLKVWSHTHKNHKPYFSKEDNRTINRLMVEEKDTVVSICIGNKYEVIGRIDTFI